jgi:hypothetical protein
VPTARGRCQVTAAESPVRRWLPIAVAGSLILIGVGLIVAGVLLPAPGSTASGSRSAGPSSTPGSPSALATTTPTPTGGLTPTPTGSPTPQPTPQPTPRVISATGVDLTWRPVARLTGDAADPSTQTVTVASVAHGPGGYIAVGTVVDGAVGELGATGPVHPGIWLSADGLSWRRGNAAALGDLSPLDVVSDGHAYLVLGYRAADRIVLRSTDGSSWTDVTPPGSQIASLLAAGPGFIASGWLAQGGAAAVWSSSGGLTWSRVYTAAPGPTAFVAGSVAPNGWILFVGQVTTSDGSTTAAAIVSPDGVRWSRAPASGLPSSMTFDAVGVGADGAWYGAGFDAASGGIGIWRSTDGLAWRSTGFGDAQRTELPGDTGSARGVFGFAGSTWVLAYTSCCGDPPQRTLKSTDAASWQRVDRGTALIGGHITATLVEPNRVIAVGVRDVGGWVWLATPPPTSGVELLTELGPTPAASVCSGSTAYRIQLQADRSGTVVRIFVNQLGTVAFPQGFPQIIWPNGWTASPGPPLVLRNGAGTLVLREGDTFTLTGGTLGAGTYHVCQLNGTTVAGVGP